MVLFLRRGSVAAMAVALAVTLVATTVRLAAAGGTPAKPPEPPAGDSAIIQHVQTRQPLIALTFDDGPDIKNTPTILALLQEHRAVATFFVTGLQVRAFPDLVREEQAEGSEVCNHSWRHPTFRGMSAATVAAELRRTEELLTALGVGGCRLFRFPYFASDATARTEVATLGYRMIGASLDPQDWRRGSPEDLANDVLAKARPGDIVVLHDGGGPRPRTIEALRLILDGLPAAGLRTATVTALLASAQPSA